MRISGMSLEFLGPRNKVQVYCRQRDLLQDEVPACPRATTGSLWARVTLAVTEQRALTAVFLCPLLACWEIRSYFYGTESRIFFLGVQNFISTGFAGCSLLLAVVTAHRPRLGL